MNCVKCKAPLPDGALYCPACGKKQAAESRKPMKRPNGMGTVYKLQGRRKRPWVAAKNKVIIGYYERRTDALTALEAMSGAEVTARYNYTFAQVYEKWSKERFRQLSVSAQNMYRSSYGIFAPLHSKKFRELRTADFQAVIDANSGKPAMMQKCKQLIGQMSKWAIREEITSTNYAQFVQLPTVETKEKEVFTDEEIAKLDADNTEAARIVSMLLSTGMRIGELFDLRLENYHGAYCVGGSKTEAGKNRIIPIRPEGRRHFEYFVRQATSDLLLSGYTGHKDVQHFREQDYKELLARLGLAYKSPHCTRHTYTSRAVKEGVQPELLQKILGHADYNTTANIYTHIDADTLVKEVESHAVTTTLLAK